MVVAQCMEWSAWCDLQNDLSMCESTHTRAQTASRTQRRAQSSHRSQKKLTTVSTQKKAQRARSLSEHGHARVMPRARFTAARTSPRRAAELPAAGGSS